MVKEAPTFVDIFDDLKLILQDHQVLVAYNVKYDVRMLRQCCKRYNTKGLEEIHCIEHPIDIMEPYAEFWGDFKPYFGSYTWQKLTSACKQQGINVVAEHSAAGDCKLTLALIKKIASMEL